MKEKIKKMGAKTLHNNALNNIKSEQNQAGSDRRNLSLLISFALFRKLNSLSIAYGFISTVHTSNLKWVPAA